MLHWILLTTKQKFQNKIIFMFSLSFVLSHKIKKQNNLDMRASSLLV